MLSWLDSGKNGQAFSICVQDAKTKLPPQQKKNKKKNRRECNITFTSNTVAATN